MPIRVSHRTRTDAGAARLFGLTLLVAGSGLGAVSLAVADGAGAIRVGPAHKFTLLHQGFSYPRANVAAVVVLALAVLGLFVLLQLMSAAVTEAIAARRFARAIAARRPRAYGGVVLVDDPTPQAFCAGLLRPRIYVSTGTLRRLRPDELESVLAHENHHRRRRDPLRIAVARMLAEAVFFLPVLRRLSARYGALAELAADDAAVRATRGGATTLASALLSFSAGAHPRSAVGIAPERVDHLLGREASWRLPAALLMGALATALTVALVAWQVGRIAVLHTTFNLPFLSTRPCVMVLAMVPGLLGVVAVRYLRRPAA